MFTKFLDPKNDFAFKRIFGTEKNKDILVHFLNDMITFKKPIQEVTFLKTHLDPETAAQKTSIVDILCKDSSGNTYIVEMQVAKEKGFEKRAQYYASKAYVSQSYPGGAYHELKEVIFLAIADFIMFPDKEAYKSEHATFDKHTGEHDLKDFSFTFFELPKFDKEVDQLITISEKWCYFFKHAQETVEKDLPGLIGEDHIMERAYEELNRFSWDDVDLLTYDQTEKYAGAYQASMEQKFDEGMAKGEAKGRVEGMAKGEAKGRVEGRAEGEAYAKLQIAKQLLDQGVSVDIVCATTGLLPEDLLVTSK